MVSYGRLDHASVGDNLNWLGQYKVALEIFSQRLSVSNKLLKLLLAKNQTSIVGMCPFVVIGVYQMILEGP